MFMDVMLTREFWVSLLEIVWVNILLSGDNAVVIALAAKRLPLTRQRQAVVLGTAAAVLMRILLTLFALQLLSLPWLKLIGAVFLVWIGAQLFCDEEETETLSAESSLFGAMRTILIADLVMSLDNVMGVAGAANAAPEDARNVLLVLGLGISIPVVAFGSGVMLGFMKRWPVIVTMGAMLLGWIAGEMAATDPFVAGRFGTNALIGYVFAGMGAILVWLLGRWLVGQQARKGPAER
jgi:YjbE family integral membrane protein